jgi:hypothetical protein
MYPGSDTGLERRRGTFDSKIESTPVPLEQPLPHKEGNDKHQRKCDEGVESCNYVTRRQNSFR